MGREFELTRYHPNFNREKAGFSRLFERASCAAYMAAVLLTPASRHSLTWPQACCQSSKTNPPGPFSNRILYRLAPCFPALCERHPIVLIRSSDIWRNLEIILPFNNQNIPKGSCFCQGSSVLPPETGGTGS